MNRRKLGNNGHKEAVNYGKRHFRQVIVVHSPDPKLFEQAIFILKDNAVGEGITDEALLKEAQKAIHTGDRTKKRRHLYLYGAVWAAGGALLTGLTWLITVLF